MTLLTWKIQKLMFYSINKHEMFFIKCKTIIEYCLCDNPILMSLVRERSKQTAFQENAAEH